MAVPQYPGAGGGEQKRRVVQPSCRHELLVVVALDTFV